MIQKLNKIQSSISNIGNPKVIGENTIHVNVNNYTLCIQMFTWESRISTPCFVVQGDLNGMVLWKNMQKPMSHVTAEVVPCSKGLINLLSTGHTFAAIHY